MLKIETINLLILQNFKCVSKYIVFVTQMQNTNLISQIDQVELGLLTNQSVDNPIRQNNIYAPILGILCMCFLFITIITFGILVVNYDDNKKNIHHTSFTLTGSNNYVAMKNNNKCYGYCGAYAMSFGKCSYMIKKNHYCAHLTNAIDAICIQNKTYPNGYYHSHMCYSSNPNKSNKYYKQKKNIMYICKISAIIIVCGMMIVMCGNCCMLCDIFQSGILFYVKP